MCKGSAGCAGAGAASICDPKSLNLLKRLTSENFDFTQQNPSCNHNSATHYEKSDLARSEILDITRAERLQACKILDSLLRY